MSPILSIRSAATTYATLVLATLAGCGHAPQASSITPLPATKISSVIVELADQGVVEILPGTVRAATAATLMARVPGVVTHIAAIPGSTVAAGTVLVELDAQELAARRDQARAVAVQATADLSRVKQLSGQQAMTKADLDAAQSRANGSAAALAEAEILVGYTRIAAPFSGLVVRKHVGVGDLITPGRPVIDMEDPASLRLEVDIPESLADRARLGASLRVRIGAGFDQACPVVEVTPAADPLSRSVLVKLALPLDAQGLWSGLFGRVSIPIVDAKVLTVPSRAIVQRGQLDALFVVQGGRAHLRLVRLGDSDEARTTIRAGIEPGERVVADGVAALSDGQAVIDR